MSRKGMLTDPKRKSGNLILTQGDFIETQHGTFYLAVATKKGIELQRREEFDGPIKTLMTWNGTEKIYRGDAAIPYRTKPNMFNWW